MNTFFLHHARILVDSQHDDKPVQCEEQLVLVPAKHHHTQDEYSVLVSQKPLLKFPNASSVRFIPHSTSHPAAPVSKKPIRLARGTDRDEPPTSEPESSQSRTDRANPPLSAPNNQQHNRNYARPPHRRARLDRAPRFPQPGRPPLDFRHWRQRPRGPCRQRLQPREGCR